MNEKSKKSGNTTVRQSEGVVEFYAQLIHIVNIYRMDKYLDT